MEKISPTSSIISDLNLEVSKATTIYRSNRTSEPLKNLITATYALSKRIRLYEFNQTTRTLNDFDQDISLEYLGMILSGRSIPNPYTKIKALISNRMNRYSRDFSYSVKEKDSFMIDNEPVQYIDDYLSIQDSLHQELYSVSEDIKTLVLYYILNYHNFKNFIKHYPSSLKKTTVILKVYEVRRKIMEEKEKNLNITFSNNRIANLLLLSGLFNESPEMFVLLTLVKDFRLFFQFINMFENKNIKVPNIQRINQIFNKASKVSTNYENNEMSLDDKENLLSLVTDVKLEDINENTKLNKFLDEYIAELVAASIENYNKIENRVFKYIDFTDPKKVRATYSVVNEELASQSKLLKEIVSTFSTIKEIRDAISLMKTTN